MSLTPIQIRRLEEVCRDRFQWSDGGHWIGIGSEPNCFIKENFQSSSTIIIRFPTDQAAHDFIRASNRSNRTMSYIVGGISTIVTGGSGAPVSAGIMHVIRRTLAGVGLSIVVGEALAARSHLVSRGWSMIYETSFNYSWSPHPLTRSTFTHQYSFSINNERNISEFRANSQQNYRLGIEFPRPLARTLAQTDSSMHFFDYPFGIPL